MDINSLTIGQLKEINALLGGANTHQPYEVGANYQIRTVTHIYTGRVVSVGTNEIVITDAAWIADTGQFADAVANGSYDEVEIYPDGKPVIIGRAAVCDAVQIKTLPRTTK